MGVAIATKAQEEMIYKQTLRLEFQKADILLIPLESVKFYGTCMRRGEKYRNSWCVANEK